MNKLIIASAGAGKTTFIVKDALEKINQGNRVLITTYTEECEGEIRKLFMEKNGCIPQAITIKTWFSLLITHGVKPYQGHLFDFDVRGMLLINGKSSLKFKTKLGVPIYWGEDNFAKFYFSGEKKIYSDKLAQLVIRCDAASKGRVFDRLSRCFTTIYIDEVQDLAGYDLEVLDCIFKSKSDAILVGDPRQAIYSTNNSRKNKKYVKSEIINFFEDSKLDITTDTNSLNVNFRCVKAIALFSNRLYPDLPQSDSGNDDVTDHDGLFAILPEHVENYLGKFSAIQLRDSKITVVHKDFDVYNFGKSKGLAWNRVVIYPSGPMVQWLKNNQTEISKTARAKLYVGITRARQSVAIVLKANDMSKVEGPIGYPCP